MEDQGILGSLGIDIGIVLLVLIVLMIVFIVLTILTIVKTNRLNKKLNGFMNGRDGASLEKNIFALYEDNKLFKEQMIRQKKDIQTLFKKQESNFQKMGLVKYDAFHQMGGQLSFSLALLDENNNGFIINSVHSTDGCYSYTKRITAGECKLALGKEEEEALSRAMGTKEVS